VATAIAGVPKVIADDQTGLLVPPDDSAALQAALRRCLTDSQLRHRLAEAARAAAVRNHSFAVRTQRLHQVYHDLLSARDI
jgi:glycosyltransferase involved in cell wall biosynthesis